MLFIDFHSSSFNTIIPQNLIEKLSLLGLNTSFCNWILDFLTGRPQSIWIRNSTSSTTTLSTGAPQGCVLSPLLFNPYQQIQEIQEGSDAADAEFMYRLEREVQVKPLQNPPSGTHPGVHLLAHPHGLGADNPRWFGLGMAGVR
ncbi:hypothetical protein QTP86_017299 [Hemibagrus guttatus]|nr:hypothetical protein QTP86_017299 [Hemibagrus guttatus]